MQHRCIWGDCNATATRKRKKTSVKRQKNEKRSFDSLEEKTLRTDISFERVNAIVELVIELAALLVIDRVRIARFLEVFADTESSGANCIPDVDGGSFDTDCRDGEESCEEVPIEHCRRRRAKSEMRGRQRKSAQGMRAGVTEGPFEPVLEPFILFRMGVLFPP